jgi:hypothetical protein
MLDLSLNMPQLTDAGAKDLAVGARDLGARATENLAKFAPSQATTLVVCLLGFGWLAFQFYKEYKSGPVQHTVVHTPAPPPPPPT